MSLEIIDRHSRALFEFLWCPVCGHDVFSHIPFEGVFCKNCNTLVEFQEAMEDRSYEDAVLACFDTDTTWNLQIDEKLRRDLPDGSARVKILGAPCAYEVDWRSPEPGDEWEAVERGELDDANEPEEVSHLA
ncbi:DUF7567 family protein [Natronosalvus rutilus]|uniref:Small CPxCG-related zinc finger protein n=1 Tax=Natronosalvus rutilus TaxID=2953753 RepID=A0A9E7SWZ1_9EURY|nr:hypothetical protein [Natronosalvus rutilus]UTF55915.1 hypothetical protein NGM29_20145 [Natronosalvus rutilus]